MGAHKPPRPERAERDHVLPDQVESLMRAAPLSDVMAGPASDLRIALIKHRLFSGRPAAPDHGERAADRPGDAATPVAELAAMATMQHDTSPSPDEDSDVNRRVAPAFAAAGMRIKQYELIRHLGSGGMGSVFVVRDRKLGRLAAMKVLHSPTAALTEHFVVEARLTARCNHEHIVVLYEVDEYRGHPYMVFEYLQGQTLRQWLDEYLVTAPLAAEVGESRLPPTRAAQLMIPVVRALVRAHEMNIVHRDLKPENIMITDAGVVKVLDFGVAKIVAGGPRADDRLPSEEADEHQVERSGAFSGTPAYMSPEQLCGSDVDHQSDIWAVGVMLYELVAGRHPLAPLSRRQLASVTELATPMASVTDRVRGLGRLGPIIDSCLRKRKDERIATARELLARLTAIMPGGRESVPDEGHSPFPGLAAFQESDADVFFGRSREVAQVVAQLRNRPLVTVVGPSGAGKSSLVRAGVIPALRRSGENWTALVVRPGRRPMAALAGAMARQLGQPPGHRERMAARLRDEPGAFGAELRDWADARPCRLVVFVDQFEELYTLDSEGEDRDAFVRCLESVADDPTSPLRLILAVRSDFLDRLAEDRGFMTQVTRGLVFLSPIDRVGLREALTQPVAAAGYRFETPELIATMLDELEATRSPLPLLQCTAARLWDSRDPRSKQLTRRSYAALGGVVGTLASHADAVLTGMTDGERGMARKVLERLVTPERTRAITTLDELQAIAGDREAVERVVHHLADTRLLSMETDRDVHGCSVELIHEALIDGWPTLQRWLDENQQDAEFLARATDIGRAMGGERPRQRRAVARPTVAPGPAVARALSRRAPGSRTAVPRRRVRAVRSRGPQEARRRGGDDDAARVSGRGRADRPGVDPRRRTQRAAAEGDRREHEGGAARAPAPGTAGPERGREGQRTSRAGQTAGPGRPAPGRSSPSRGGGGAASRRRRVGTRAAGAGGDAIIRTARARRQARGARGAEARRGLGGGRAPVRTETRRHDPQGAGPAEQRARLRVRCEPTLPTPDASSGARADARGARRPAEPSPRSRS